MAGSLNKVTLIGNVGNEPEIRSTQSGSKIANLSLATSETWKDKNSGDRKEKTEWHRIVIFSEGLAGIVEKYVSKGSKIYVEGKLQTRKYTDSNNVERYSTEIVLQGFGDQLLLLSGNGGSGGGDQQSSSGGGQRRQPPTQDLDDEIPF